MIMTHRTGWKIYTEPTNQNAEINRNISNINKLFQLKQKIPEDSLNKNDLILWKSLISSVIDNSNSVNDIFMLLSTTYKFAFFNLISPYLSIEDYSSLLGCTYTNTDNPNEILTKSQLLKLFKQAKPQYLMNEDELETFQKLPNRLTIYRGIKTTNKNHINSLSWTTDFKTAKFFSERFGKNGTIYQANINKEHILAYFNRRNEKEVIVDYKFLENVTSVDKLNLTTESEI